MSHRILIMSASVGSGHVHAAEALAKAFQALPGVGEVVCDDALEYTSVLHKSFYGPLYAKLSELAPEFLGWWYENSDDPWQADQVRLILDLPHTMPLIRYVQEFKPDAIVCTHFMPAGVLSFLIGRKRLDTKLSVVVTDFHFHAQWMLRAFNRYFVAQEEDKVHMGALGIPEDRVSVTGIPVDAKFSDPVDREAVCRRLGLDPTKRILLLSAGALGLSPAASVVRRLKDMTQDFHTVVLCGRNEEVHARVTEAAEGALERFTILGYTDRMHELMNIATVMLTKPGGLTTAEALACGLPLVVLDPIGGQEERNAEMLLENGAAIKCGEVTLLPYKLGCLLDDPERLATMAANAGRLGRPQAANDIARIVKDDTSENMLVTQKEARRLRKAITSERKELSEGR